jgi:glycoprotein endo-alpha-1,2-mannosidase
MTRKSTCGIICVLVAVLASTTATFAQATRPARRIALISDPHVSVDPRHADYVQNFERVIDDVNAAKVDAVLLAGDLTQSGDAASMQRFAKMVKRIEPPTRWVAGNHDVGNKPVRDKPVSLTAPRIARYEEHLGPPFYAVDLLPGLRVAGIASSLFTSDLPVEAAQWAMLERELNPSGAIDAEARGLLLLTHYPPFVTSADEPDEYFNINGPARRRLMEMIERGNVTAVLSGHLHRPVSLAIGRVPLVGAPAVSFGLPRGKQGVGWSLVTIDPGGKVTAENRYVAAAPSVAPATRPATTSLIVNTPAPTTAPTSDRVHIFYYNWYGSPPMQKRFVHWQQGGHAPPEDIGANYYPKLGAYSSGDPAVLKQHMAWIKQASVGTLCLTWWGRDSYEEKGTQAVLDAAADAGLKVNFHLEPYRGHTPDKLAADVRYLLAKYGKHAAFYRAASHGNRPIFYVFETIRHPSDAWRKAIDGLRAEPGEPFLIIAQTSDVNLVEAGGFDGGYPYDGLAPFKNNGFLRQWPSTARRFEAAGKIFIPSVGPGYWDDRALRAGGADEPVDARTRDNGKATTYDAAWSGAIDARAPFVTITSFNEWHEGSQIEPAVAKTIDGYEYPAYHEGEKQYIDRTAQWVTKFAASVVKPTAP